MSVHKNLQFQGPLFELNNEKKEKLQRKKVGSTKQDLNSLFGEHKKENEIGKDSIWNSLIRKLKESSLHMKCKRKHLV